MIKNERLDKFHNAADCFAYEFFGCHKLPDGKYIFRVWAPHAKTVSLIGSFNGWNENSAVMTRLSDNESFETVTAEKSKKPIRLRSIRIYRILSPQKLLICRKNPNTFLKSRKTINL